MSLLSSLDEIYVCVKLLADNTREAEYYKTSFFSVGVNIFDRLLLRKRPISFPMHQKYLTVHVYHLLKIWIYRSSMNLTYFLVSIIYT